MKFINKLVISLILLYLAWRWLNQPSQPRLAHVPQRPSQPFQPGKSQPITLPVERVDDLTAINGIGPKASRALSLAGVRSFEQLSHIGIDQLKDILASNALAHLDPASWAEQAASLDRSK